MQCHDTAEPGKSSSCACTAETCVCTVSGVSLVLLPSFLTVPGFIAKCIVLDAVVAACRGLQEGNCLHQQL